jgi:hypothetical protein
MYVKQIVATVWLYEGPWKKLFCSGLNRPEGGIGIGDASG